MLHCMLLPTSLRSRIFLLGFTVAGCTTPALRGAGSPPFITDDPGTPGDGHWEINLGVTTEQRPGLHVTELPLLDLNYGIGDRLQIKYEAPYLWQSETQTSAVSGLGNSALGVKWRFFDAGGKGLLASVYPQFEFNNPGSSSSDRGLVQPGSAVRLPFQFAKEVGPVELVWQVGREFRPAGDAWFYGISAGHNISDKVMLAVELAGGANAGLHRSSLTANFGAAVDLSECTSLLFSVGRELHNHDEPCATLVAYVGLQWRL